MSLLWVPRGLVALASTVLEGAVTECRPIDNTYIKGMHRRRKVDEQSNPSFVSVPTFRCDTAVCPSTESTPPP